MNITWLGHGGFRIEIGDQILLVDPWLDGNPAFPDERRTDAISGASNILLTHGHFDHTGDIAAVASQTGAPVLAMVELADILEAQGLQTTGFNYGGTVMCGDVAVTMVTARHSSSIMVNERQVYCGAPAGFMINHGGRTLYVSGDTDIMADMEWMGDLHQPEIGILCCGGHFTMDMERAAYAARRYFNFKTVIPCHYQTFPLLAQSAEPLVDALPGVSVKTPGVMEPIAL